ncbi:helix-turn-helix domain-containing protein [Alcanivorax sp. IL3]|uniref:helix-turn-helix domain-containing protein n=1 Tax=unclassified Alcanivorax TaxID=2638842 RepID=UPI0039C0167E
MPLKCTFGTSYNGTESTINSRDNEPMVHTEENAKEEFARRLKAAAKEAGHEARGLGTFLAKITGTTPKAASKWLGGESIPRPDKLLVIARKLGVSQQWLQYGEPDNFRINEETATYQQGNVQYAGEEISSRVAPVISWVQAGEWCEAIDLHTPGFGEDFEPVPSTSGPNVFWLRVVGDSMTAQSGLSVPEGHLILVDPDMQADNGSLVVAKLDETQEVTFKQLVIDAGHKYLKPLNRDYKTIPINGNCRIVGVVKEAKLKF